MKEICDKPGHWVHVTCVAAIQELRPLGKFHVCVVGSAGVAWVV
jgi:hypothetical protein